MKSTVMKRAITAALGAVLVLGVAHAASKVDAEHALAAAKADMKVAAHMNNQWTPTVSAFKKAEKAMAAKKYESAEAHAKKARALALASIKQAREQKHLWKNEVPR